MNPDNQAPIQPTSGQQESMPPAIHSQDASGAPQQGDPASILTAPQSISSSKKSYDPRRFIIILSTIVAICLLAVATALLMILQPWHQPKRTETPSAIVKSPTTKAINAKQAITHVREYFKADGVAKGSITLPVRANGKDFYTIIPEAAGLESVAGEVAADKSEAQLTSVVHSLEGDGFAKRIQHDGITGNYLADFSLAKTFCEVALIKPADSKAPQWLEVRCADMATYDAYAEAQEPLVRLYTPLSATSVQYGFVGKPVPVPGKTTGYSTTELQVSIIVDSAVTSTGKYALYYQTPDGLWHYWRDRDTSAIFACDQYDTNELKKAYLGTACRDTVKNIDSTVPAPRKQ